MNRTDEQRPQYGASDRTTSLLKRHPKGGNINTLNWIVQIASSTGPTRYRFEYYLSVDESYREMDNYQMELWADAEIIYKVNYQKVRDNGMTDHFDRVAQVLADQLIHAITRVGLWHLQQNVDIDAIKHAGSMRELMALHKSETAKIVGQQNQINERLSQLSESVAKRYEVLKQQVESAPRRAAASPRVAADPPAGSSDSPPDPARPDPTSLP